MSATSSSWANESQPITQLSGMVASSAARPRSVQISTGRRRSLSTHAPAARPITRPATRSMLLISATPRASAPRARMATSGSAIRVMKLPKIEIVSAVQTRRNAGFAHNDSFARSSITARTLASAVNSPAVFDQLSDRLRDALNKLSGRGKVTEADVDAAMRDVRLALLEADVNFRVVKDFVARVRARAVGAEVLDSLNAGQQVIKIVHEELTAILGAGDRAFHLSGSPAVVLLVGLQGSGKTTSSAKLAVQLTKQGRRPMLIAADPYRPAASQQLQTLGQSINTPVHPAGTNVAVLDTVRAGIAEAKRTGRDTAIVDTAGRLSIDEELMAEIRDLANAVKPSEK